MGVANYAHPGGMGQMRNGINVTQCVGRIKFRRISRFISCAGANGSTCSCTNMQQL